MADAKTQEYFDREKESRLQWHQYFETLSESVERLDMADAILWNDEVEQYIAYEDELDENWEKVIDEFHTDRDKIEEAIVNYYEPLSIEKRVRVDPRDSSHIIDKDDAKYKIVISLWWPTVYRDIDWTAELHMYWWGDHLTRDFGRDFADDLLSFYWLY